MTYHAYGRSVMEVIVAAIIVGFLTGFVAVLCIGNYFRAKKAMERQRQRRLARLSNGGNAGEETVSFTASPAHSSSATSGGSSTFTGDERKHLLAKSSDIPRRRINNNEAPDMLLFPPEQQEREMKILQV